MRSRRRPRRAWRGAARSRAGRSGSGAAGAHRPRRRTRRRPGGRAGPSCRSARAAASSRRGRPAPCRRRASARRTRQDVGEGGAHRGLVVARRPRRPGRRRPPRRAPRGGRRRRRRAPRRGSRRAGRRAVAYGEATSASLSRAESPPSRSSRASRRGSGTASSSRRRTPSRWRAAASSAEPKTGSPTVAALVGQRRVGGDLVARAALGDRGGQVAEDPGGLAGAGQPGVVGDLGERLGELRAQRRLERLEVLAPRLLGAGVVDHAVGRAQVLGDLGPVPGVAGDDDPGRGPAPPLEGVEQRLLARPGSRARKSRARSGAGTSATRSGLGRLRIRRGDELVAQARDVPGEVVVADLVERRDRHVDGQPVVVGAGLEVIADRERQPSSPSPSACQVVG